MLEKKFIRQGLLDFDYKNTSWYKKIRTENKEYRFNLILYALFVALIIPSVLTLTRILDGRFFLIPVQIASIIILLFLIFVLIHFHKIRLMSFIVLILPVIGFYASLYQPGGDRIYILLLAVYPALAIQLRGSKKGSFWCIFAGFIFVIFSMLLAFGLVPDCEQHCDFETLIVFGSTYFLIWLLSYAFGKRQENLVEQLTNMLVFDESTGLPCRDVLLNSIHPEKKYVFAIIKIENFSDLVALFGYEFSDIISQFASRKLLKYESFYRYRTYQLKYNEYGILIECDVNHHVPEATLLVSKIIKSLDLESLPWEQDRIRLVYRLGATIIVPGDGKNPLSRADIALKKAERTHSVFTVFDNDAIEKTSAYESVIGFTELINNRQNGTFRVVFQPIFSHAGKKIAWYEALLRIRREDGEYVSIHIFKLLSRPACIHK